MQYNEKVLDVKTDILKCLVEKERDEREFVLKLTPENAERQLQILKERNKQTELEIKNIDLITAPCPTCNDKEIPKVKELENINELANFSVY